MIQAGAANGNQINTVVLDNEAINNRQIKCREKNLQYLIMQARCEFAQQIVWYF